LPFPPHFFLIGHKLGCSVVYQMKGGGAMTEWSRPDQAERFIREYADPILRVCAAYSLGRADAQDICQDIFLTLLEEKQSFQGPEHERAFILRCAINASKDLLKSSRFRRTAPLEEAERVAAPSPGEVHEVWQAVERLPDRERILVYLFYCEGYGLEEAAGMCGCSYAAARQRLSRARKRLRSELEVYDG
jgi:RNA polymerase sigma factor (sigma-70 family)